MVDWVINAELICNKPAPAGGVPTPRLYVKIEVSASGIQAAISTATNFIKRYTEGNAVSCNIWHVEEILDVNDPPE